MNIIRKIFQKRKKEAAAIGIIGGADGPTGVFIAGKKTSNNSDQQTFLKYVKTKMMALKPDRGLAGGCISFRLSHNLGPAQQFTEQTGYSRVKLNPCPPF